MPHHGDHMADMGGTERAVAAHLVLGRAQKAGLFQRGTAEQRVQLHLDHFGAFEIA